MAESEWQEVNGRSEEEEEKEEEEGREEERKLREEINIKIQKKYRNI